MVFIVLTWVALICSIWLILHFKWTPIFKRHFPLEIRRLALWRSGWQIVLAILIFGQVALLSTIFFSFVFAYWAINSLQFHIGCCFVSVSDLYDVKTFAVPSSKVDELTLGIHDLLIYSQFLLFWGVFKNSHLVSAVCAVK